MMFAVWFDRFGGPEVLQLGEAEVPAPAEGQIRIRVRAAGVSPVDAGLRSGATPTSARLPLPHIPGVDAAGIVDALGAGVTGVAVGDEVFGSVDVAKLGGASAEFAVLQLWAPKPPGMPWTQAGAAGTSVETATRALDRLDLRPGATLLIDGAAGGVGSVAVQLAVARGVRVIGTARPAGHDFVAELGATPIAYGPGLPGRVAGLDAAVSGAAANRTSVDRALGGSVDPALGGAVLDRASDGAVVDRALDVAGGGSLAELVALTGDPAKVLTLADFTAAEHGVRLSMGRLAGEPDGGHGLHDAAALFTEGRFRVPIEAAHPLAKVADAHAALDRGPRRGKIVLTVD